MVVQNGFIGDNEDGNFCCNATIEIKKGSKTKTERFTQLKLSCGYYIEKIRHLPDGSYEMIKTIKIEDVIPDLMKI